MYVSLTENFFFVIVKMTILYFHHTAHLHPQFPADLVTLTKEILNEKLHFFYSVNFTELCKRKDGWIEACVESSSLPFLVSLLIIYDANRTKYFTG